MLRQLGVKPGDAVEITADQDHLSVSKADDPISKFIGILWRPDLPVLSDEELEAEIKRASEEGATRRYLRTLPPDHPDVRRYERLTESRDQNSG